MFNQVQFRVDGEGGWECAIGCNPEITPVHQWVTETKCISQLAFILHPE